MVRAYATVFTLEKSGSRPEDNEDAFRVDPERLNSGEEIDTHLLSVAVSDGATEGMLSRPWAVRLTNAAGRLAKIEELEPCLLQCIANWPADVEKYKSRRARQGRPLKWYEEAKIADGAFATLVVTIFKGPEHGTWEAGAIGDACVAQVRNDEMTACFPIGTVEEFGNSPSLVPSSLVDKSALRRAIKYWRGDWQAGDVFFVMTDAVSAWFLGSVVDGHRPWRLLRELANQQQFEDWVRIERGRGRMRNDDATLVCIDF